MAVRVQGISKSFGPVQALKNVSLSVRRGTIHALVGENGAGKSTLMRILDGAVRADEGEIQLFGETTAIRDPHHARELGIQMIHQELSLVPYQRVWENICLGVERTRTRVFLDKRAMKRQAAEALERLGSTVSVHAKVSDLPLAEQQVVEIAKALARDSRILILDEPTAALETHQVEVLFDVLNRVREQGRTAVYVSHRLGEVLSLCDQVTVLRDGAVVGDNTVANMTQDELIRMMLGTTLGAIFPPRAASSSKESVLVKLDAVSTETIRDVTIDVVPGLVTGITGLAGAGVHELGRVLTGGSRPVHGGIAIDGRQVRLTSPRVALRNGVVYVPADRRREGIFPILAVRENIAIGTLDERVRFGFIRRGAEEKLVKANVDRLRIQTPTIMQEVGLLSGGNQQKILLARWLAAQPRVMVLDEPTRGIDVGTKAEIYALMREFADAGVAVVMISTDLTEVVGMSDEIVAMRGGRVVKRLEGGCPESDVLSALV
jgi:ABC-type sugar transport system ATPase subunit